MSEYNKNDYRILGNNGKKMVFKIPVGNMTPAEAKKELEKLIADYKEPIMFCGATGPIGENGILGQDPYTPIDNIKDYWIPTRESSLDEDVYSTGHGYVHPPQPTKIPVEKKKSWFRKLFS